MQHHIAFWTPAAPPPEGVTGCASHGVAAPSLWVDPDEPAVVRWPTEVAGEVIAGTHAEVLAGLSDLQPRALLVFATRGEGMAAWLADLRARLGNVPTVGGVAAWGHAGPPGSVRPGAEMVVLALTDGDWRAETLNVHDVIEPVEVEADGLRTIARMRREGGDWQPAAVWFRAAQSAHNIGHADCESLTVSDLAGRNVHAGFDGDVLRVGADLPADGRMLLRAAPREVIAARMADFCAVPDALVAGCAGLRGVLTGPVTPGPGSVVGFLYGEIVTLDGVAVFGNLMMGRLRRA